MLIDCGQPIFPLQRVATVAFDLSIDSLMNCHDSLFFQFLLLEMAYSFEILNFVDSDSKLAVLVPQLRPSDCAANFEIISISWLQRINQRIDSLKYAYPNSSGAAV